MRYAKNRLQAEGDKESTETEGGDEGAEGSKESSDGREEHNGQSGYGGQERGNQDTEASAKQNS